MRHRGQLGDERFDREVAPRCRPRFIGQERFYLREDLDAWTHGLPVDRLGGREADHTDPDTQPEAFFAEVKLLKTEAAENASAKLDPLPAHLGGLLRASPEFP